jgi:hypothetical protein
MDIGPDDGVGIKCFFIYTIYSKRKTGVANSRLSVVVTTPVLKGDISPPDALYILLSSV